MMWEACAEKMKALGAKLEMGCRVTRCSYDETVGNWMVEYEDQLDHMAAQSGEPIYRHDLILLGERGQAKTRLVRHLVNLMDEQTPVIAGCEINDHPFRPICARCRALVAEDGDNAPIT